MATWFLKKQTKPKGKHDPGATTAGNQCKKKNAHFTPYDQVFLTGKPRNKSTFIFTWFLTDTQAISQKNKTKNKKKPKKLMVQWLEIHIKSNVYLIWYYWAL